MKTFIAASGKDFLAVAQFYVAGPVLPAAHDLLAQAPTR
jgi:hypothetical protein